MYTNLRSIRNKVTEFASTVSIVDPDIFCVVETWLTSDYNNGKVKLENYYIFRKDRDSRGGCILIGVEKLFLRNPIFIKKKIKFYVLIYLMETKTLLRIINVYNSTFQNFKMLKSILNDIGT